MGTPREKRYLSRRERLWVLITAVVLLLGGTLGFAFDLVGLYVLCWLFGGFAMVVGIAGYVDK